MAKIKEKLIISDDILTTMKTSPKNGWKKLLAAAIILGITIWSMSAIHFSGVNVNGRNIVFRILALLVYPDAEADLIGFSVINKYFFTFERWGVPYLMYETIMIAFIGTILGAIISIPLAFLSSRNITGNIVSFIGSMIITLIRTVPIFIWGIIFIRIQGGALAGVLAIAVSSTGMISKLFIETIEDIDKGILEALDSTGATILQKIRFGIIPQLSASFLSTAIYRFEINVKNATILGLVGAGGIGFTLLDALGSGNFGIVAVCLWGIIPVVLLIEYFSGKIRTKLV